MATTYTLDKEIQCNKWLFDKIQEQIHQIGFMVEPSASNKEIIPNVCEFSTSSPDCVIYHERKGFSFLQSLLKYNAKNTMSMSAYTVNNKLSRKKILHVYLAKGKLIVKTTFNSYINTNTH